MFFISAILSILSNFHRLYTPLPVRWRYILHSSFDPLDLQTCIKVCFNSILPESANFLTRFWKLVKALRLVWLPLLSSASIRLKRAQKRCKFWRDSKVLVEPCRASCILQGMPQPRLPKNYPFWTPKTNPSRCFFWSKRCTASSPVAWQAKTLT